MHARPGAAADVLAAWRETLGDAFWVVPQDEAVATGLYGPVVGDDVRARLGDVLAVPVRDHWVGDSRVLPPAILQLVGMHGGALRRGARRSRCSCTRPERPDGGVGPRRPLVGAVPRPPFPLINEQGRRR